MSLGLFASEQDAAKAGKGLGFRVWGLVGFQGKGLGFRGLGFFGVAGLGCDVLSRWCNIWEGI